MREAYIKCIRLFAENDSRVLIISFRATSTKNLRSLTGFTYKIDFLNISNLVAYQANLNRVETNFSSKANLEKIMQGYNLIILDLVIDSNEPSMQFLTLSCPRTEMLSILNNKLAAQGNLVILANNAVCYKKPTNFVRGMSNFFLKNNILFAFNWQYVSALRKAKFGQIDSFYIRSDFHAFWGLIARKRYAFHTMLSRIYGLPDKIFKHPGSWLPWFMINTGLMRASYDHLLILAKK